MLYSKRSSKSILPQVEHDNEKFPEVNELELIELLPNQLKGKKQWVKLLMQEMKEIIDDKDNEIRSLEMLKR